MRTREEIQTALDRAFPEQFTDKKNGFTYAKGWKVIELLNEILGFEGWSEFIREYEVVHVGKREDKNDYHCVVRCILRIASAGTAREDVGYGYGYGKDPGSA